MVDPLQRKSFEKPAPTVKDFHALVKEIRHEMNELLKGIFFSSDLEKRQKSFQDLKNLEKRFNPKFETVSKEKKKEIVSALHVDLKKLETALKNVNISIFLKVDGVHVPLLCRETNKPFTLFDFLNDSKMLSDKEIAFEFHTKTVDGDFLGAFFPGFNDEHFLTDFENRERLHLPFPYKFQGIEYLLRPAQPSGSYTIVGKCLLKNLSHNVQYDIPHGVMPGDLNQALDNLMHV